MFNTSELQVGSTSITFAALLSVLSVWDLGVTIDEDLKFHDHTLFVTSKANCILGIIKKKVLPVWTLA